jgi:hypothetical protein
MPNALMLRSSVAGGIAMARNVRFPPYDEPFPPHDEQTDEAFDRAEGDSNYGTYGNYSTYGSAYGSRPSAAMTGYSASDEPARDDSMPLFLSNDEPEVPRRRGFGTGSDAFLDRPPLWPRVFKAAIFTTLAAAIAFAVASMDNPLALFANAKASLPNTSAASSDATAPVVQPTAVQSAAHIPTSPPASSSTSPATSPSTSPSSASVMPTRDEIAAVLRGARQGQPETPQPKSAAAPSKRLDAGELANLLKRAKGLIAVGDIAPARLLLERAANAQEASAALLLAQTYDPAVLGTQDMRSITPDPEQARAWYLKAAQLGSSDAQQLIVQTQK